MSQDKKEIRIRFDDLEKELSMLEEEIGMLASAIVPVTSQEVNVTDDGKLRESQAHTCEMSEKIAVETARVKDARLRLKSLSSRVQI